MATCMATSTAPVRLRSMAERTGRRLRLIACSSLALQVDGGGETSDAPRGIEAGGQRCGDREPHGPDDSDGIEVRQLLVASAPPEVGGGVHVVHGGEAERREHEPEQRTEQ